MLEKLAIKEFKFKVNSHSSVPHFLFRILIWLQINYKSSLGIICNLPYMRDYQNRWTEN